MRLDYLTIFPGYLDDAAPPAARPGGRLGLVEVHVHDLLERRPPAPHRRRQPVRRGRRDGDDARAVGRGARRAPAGLRRRADRDRADALRCAGSTRPAGPGLSTRERLVFARPLPGHRPAGVLTPRPADPRRGASRSRSATTCSTAERSRRCAITEAVVPAPPGFMGNAESLDEECHEDGLLEYPVYTRPASWRGYEVPPVPSPATTRRSRPGGARSPRRYRTATPGPPAPGEAGDRQSGRSCRRHAARRRRVVDPAAGLLGAGGARERQPRRSIPALHQSLTTCWQG